jgi:hypothetical protein
MVTLCLAKDFGSYCRVIPGIAQSGQVTPAGGAASSVECHVF